MSASSVLVIDDEAMVLVYLERYLVQQGYLVFTSTNAVDGMSTAIIERPDIVLVDFALCDREDGLVVLERLRHTLPKARVLMISGVLDPSLDRRCIAAGADGFLRKPINLEELARQLKNPEEPVENAA